MRILLCYEHVRRLNGTHGEWVTSIGRRLAQRGHDVHVLCDSVADPTLYPELTFHARRPFVRGESHRLLLLRAWATYQLKRIPHDVSISFHPAIPADAVAPLRGWVQTRLAREFRHHRNVFWNLCLHLHPPVSERKIVESLLRRDGRRVRHIVALSRNMADMLRERYPRIDHRVQMLAGASSIEAPRVERDQQQQRVDARRMLGIDDKEVVFLWATKRIGWHGASYLIEAFAKATAKLTKSRARLILASEQQWSLHRLAARHHCLDRTIILGRTDRLDRLLAACDVGVNPAILSHLGRFNWECLAFGKPVIASSFAAGIDRMRAEDQRLAGRIIRPYDIPTLRHAIDDMLDDSLRQAATRLARQIAPSMSFDLFVDRFEQLARYLAGDIESLPELEDGFMNNLSAIHGSSANRTSTSTPSSTRTEPAAVRSISPTRLPDAAANDDDTMPELSMSSEEREEVAEPAAANQDANTRTDHRE